MDTSNDDQLFSVSATIFVGSEDSYFMLDHSGLQIFDDFIACGRIQAAGWLVQEEYLGCSDELAGNREPAFLTA